MNCWRQPELKGRRLLLNRGVGVAVLVAMDEWTELKSRARPGVKQWLLAPEGRTESLTSPRVKHRHRTLPDLD